MLSHHSGHVLIEATVRQPPDHKAGLIGTLTAFTGFLAKLGQALT